MPVAQSTANLFPVANYPFGEKDAQPELDPSVPARLARLQREYATDGMRRTVEAVLLVHQHGHPHILLFQIANSFFKLPGDSLNPGEDEAEGMKRILTHMLSPDGHRDSWQIGELLSTWYRPNFETYMYPYVPPHITKPKEQKKIFLIQLPEKKLLAVPRNMKLIAVPLFEIYENSGRYGQQIAGVAQLMSRFNWLFN